MSVVIKSETPSVQLTILVVDDDMLIVMNATDMLEDLGHRAIMVGSATKALEHILSDEKIDLLITDYAMPGMNGLELARKARELRPHLPVLLATGYSELPVDEKIEFLHLGKPYTQHELVAKIGLALAATDKPV